MLKINLMEMHGNGKLNIKNKTELVYIKYIQWKIIIIE
jgi:hypothetical protein